jgi:uncharacterized lipoprotein YajG
MRKVYEVEKSMNKKLRTLSLLLALAMMFGLFAGCSKDSEPTDPRRSTGAETRRGSAPAKLG